MQANKLTPAIGAEISGVDLSTALDTAALSALHGALLEHRVLEFRDQALTREQHKAFDRRFGERVAIVAGERPAA